VKDDILRETLTRAARGEPPVGDAWARFQLRRRRGRRLRNALVGLFGAGAAAVLFFTLPSGLGPGDPTDVNAGGPFAPPFRDAQIYEDPIAGFKLLYPADWAARGEPGEAIAFFVDVDDLDAILSDVRTERPSCEPADCRPEDQTRVIEAPKRFFVEITPIPPDCARFSGACVATEGIRPMNWIGFEQLLVTQAEASGARTATDPATIAGIPARRHGFIFPARPRTPPGNGERPLYWCGGCAMVEYLADWQAGWVLDIRIVAPDEDVFADHGPNAIRLVESIERYIPDDRL